MPLLNLAASVLANVVVQNKLDAPEELEMFASEFDELFHTYLEAYSMQEVSA